MLSSLSRKLLKGVRLSTPCLPLCLLFHLLMLYPLSVESQCGSEPTLSLRRGWKLWPFCAKVWLSAEFSLQCCIGRKDGGLFQFFLVISQEGRKRLFDSGHGCIPTFIVPFVGNWVGFEGSRAVGGC